MGKEERKARSSTKQLFTSQCQKNQDPSRQETQKHLSTRLSHREQSQIQQGQVAEQIQQGQVAEQIQQGQGAEQIQQGQGAKQIQQGQGAEQESQSPALARFLPAQDQIRQCLTPLLCWMKKEKNHNL